MPQGKHQPVFVLPLVEGVSGGQLEALRWLCHLEIANQSSHFNGASIINADYCRVRLGPRFGNQWVLRFDLEALNGNGTYAFQAPFATSHAYNGRTVVFALGTPADSVDDRYSKFEAPIGGARIEVAYRQFDTDQGSLDFGDEVNIIVSQQFKEHFLIFIEHTNYGAKTFGADTIKASLSFRYQM